MRAFEIRVLKYINCLFFYCTNSSVASSYKKYQITLDLLTDIYMLLVVEKGIKGGICHVIHQYAKSNNKYMKDYGCKKSI